MVTKSKMIRLDLEKPVEPVFFGEFLSPERGWRHLTRNLIDYELMIVTEGTLLIGDDKEEYRVNAGEYLLMPPTRYQHGTHPCRCRFFWLHFRCGAENADCSLPKTAQVSDMDAVRTIFQRMFEAERADPQGLQLKYLATFLLFELVNVEAQEAPLSARARLTERIKELVFRYRFTDPKIAALARELGYHEKYLSAAFRAETGTTLKRYIASVRLAEAKRMLLETDYTASEIGYYLNFPVPQTFFRFFRTETGMTATEFRAAHSI